MARGVEAASRDPHQRFAEWLATGADEDPPRDLAVHAAVCAGCQQRIAGLDMLTAIDPALAGIPPLRPVPASGWLLTNGRAAVMVGGMAALLAVGLGSWRLIQASSPLGPAVESPTQAVLGGTGVPEPTPSARASVVPTTVDQTPSGAPPAQDPTAAPPSAIPQPPPPEVQPTPKPTKRQTATARPSPTPTPPPPAPTASPTPPPTAEPTPEPTPTQPGPP